MADNEDVENVSGRLDLSVLQWLQQAVGEAMPPYLLNCDSDTIQSIISERINLSEKQADVIRHLNVLRQAIPADLGENGSLQAARVWLTQVGQDGRTVARATREHVAGAEALPTTQDELERAFAILALDTYPAYLYSPDPDIPALPLFERPSIHVTSLLFHHPQAKVFSEGALKDAVLGKVFATETEHTGHIATIYRNTGQGGGVQLSMLPEMLFSNAWGHLDEKARSATAFATAAVDELRIVRDLLVGKPSTAKALTAFTGVLLPPGAQIQLRGGGVVRPVTEADRKMVPDGLKGQLSTTDQAGNSTVINYDGDVLLESTFPYKVRLMPSGDETPTPWPEDMRPPASLEQASTRLRIALTLAVEREQRVQLVQTWRSFEEPLGFGRGMSWSDPRQAAGLMPTQLTEAEVTSWAEWYKRLSSPRIEKIEVALTRILRALAERREPSDVLIDSVIAWENIFGSREGEPTLRVTASLAKLLEKTPAARKASKTKLGDIYRLRSDVVHGNAPLDISQYPLCQEALDMAIKAVRILTTERTDILELPDGSARSNRLILE